MNEPTRSFPKTCIKKSHQNQLVANFQDRVQKKQQVNIPTPQNSPMGSAIRLDLAQELVKNQNHNHSTIC